MEYIVCKKFTPNPEIGTLKVGTRLTTSDDRITKTGLTVCYRHSQNAKDYLAWNEDGKGQRRFSLIEDINAKLAELNNAYLAAVGAADEPDAVPCRHADLLASPEYARFRGPSGWSDAFYEAGIRELTDLLEALD